MFSTDNVNINNLRSDLKKTACKDTERVKNILKKDDFIYV